jgi:hypothetical protein
MHNHNVFARPIDESLQNKPRVFISHRNADKEYARAVASYFETIGLHYYFDEEDEVLASALRVGNSKDAAIVEAIDHGLAHSTHLLAVLSRRTMGSWWVPYEIGVARATKRDVGHLLLSSLSVEMVPEYLRLYPRLWSANELFEWVSAFTPWQGYLVVQQHQEYLSDIFGELDPDEETVEHWYAMANRINGEALTKLDVIIKSDS